MQTQCGKGSLEIEKGFSLYKWPFLANRNWPKKKKPRRRISITARLPFKRHRRSLCARIYTYTARKYIVGKIRTHKRRNTHELDVHPAEPSAISVYNGAINAAPAIRAGE